MIIIENVLYFFSTLVFGVKFLLVGGLAHSLNATQYFDDPDVAAFVSDLQSGRADRVAAALGSGMDPNVEGKEGFRPIFFVFQAQTTDAARALLAAGADPNARMPNGNPPLMLSVRMDNPAFTELLLSYGADPNGVGENDKPVLFEAVRSGVTEHIERLAGAGADLDRVWGFSTPLISAVRGTSWRSASVLLDLGSDPSWRPQVGRSRMTAAEILCWMFTREPHPLKVAGRGQAEVRVLLDAFARRGVMLPCSGILESS